MALFNCSSDPKMGSFFFFFVFFYWGGEKKETLELHE